MIDEKAKRKNDEEAFINDWIAEEKNARRLLSGAFILITIIFFILVNPLQYFGNGDNGFLIFYTGIIALPALAGLIMFAVSSNEDWTRRQIEKSIEKWSSFNNFAGYLFIVLAGIQFLTGGGEQKFLFSPCFIAMGIFLIWRNNKYQSYLARFGEEKAK